MDGGRRLLRPVDGLKPALASPRAALAGAPANSFHGLSFFQPRLRNRAKTARRKGLRASNDEGSLVAFLRLPGLGSVLAIAFLGGAGLLGTVAGGQYALFVAENGRPRDLIAREFGFGLDAVTIAGQIEVGEKEILDVAGVDPKLSLPFLDADEMRRKLLAVPLIKNVSVRKLFPDRLVIDVTERRPFGLWQKGGAVSIVAADGAPIDSLHDPKFESLPFVVGEGANERIGEYASLLEAAGDLRSKISAGILVSQRRWTLKMKTGVEVLLPEVGPKAAVARLARMEQDAHVLEKDVVSLDLRVPGKLYVRLTEEAAAAREAARSHGKGART